MRILDPRDAAGRAVSANAGRPATAVVHDVPDARLVVFRLAPGQSVAPHRSMSTVMLSVLGGRGLVSGKDGEQEVRPGDVVLYEPEELHGMRAPYEELTLLATIAPRPGAAPAAIERAASHAGHVTHDRGDG